MSPEALRVSVRLWSQRRPGSLNSTSHLKVGGRGIFIHLLVRGGGTIAEETRRRGKMNGKEGLLPWPEKIVA